MAQGHSKVRVIKRYANRKLYDMSESCYITHDEIANLVRQGEEVKIIDNRTKEDLTRQTLTQILFDKERKHSRTLPLNTLRGLFESGGDFINRHITQPVTTFRDEAEEKVRNVFRSRAGDEESEPEVGANTPPDRPPTSAETAAQPEVAAPSRPRGAEGLREWLDNMQRTFDSTQRNLEERWSLVINSLGQFDNNGARIAELDARVAELEARLAVLEGEASK